MVEIPKITGSDVLREILRLTADLPRGAQFGLEKFDGADLHNLTADVLRDDFHFDPETARTVEADLRSSSLARLSQAIGVKLVVDPRSNKSVIPNAGIIRSAGAAAGEDETLEEMLEIMHKIRHG